MPRPLATVLALLALAAVAPSTASAVGGRADATVAAIKTAQTTRVDDPLYSQQWGFTATNAAGAWQAATHLQPIVVAVVDSGVDASHPDLAGKVLPGWNVIAGNTDTADDNGHGTAVAGIIAAVTGNGTGIASYCWRCLILPVKVLDAHGVGDTGNVATGIRWAADHGARVINVSLGTLVDDSRLRDAVTYARSKGALVVAAAGNLGLPRFEFPAADPGALAVGGIDPTGALASWSANGPWVQLAAPGTNISTARGGGYAPFAGTSSAAPVVSGIAAEALSAVPRATADQLTQALEQTAHATAGVEYGRVDAGALVTALSASVVPTVVRTTASARVARAAR